MAKLISVIQTEICRGMGRQDDPTRRVVQFWSTDGKLLAENDPVSPQYDTSECLWIIPSWIKTKVGALNHNDVIDN